MLFHIFCHLSVIAGANIVSYNQLWKSGSAFNSWLIVSVVIAGYGLLISASWAQDVWLAKGGQSESVIVIGQNAGEFYGWVAQELQRYLRDLSGGEFQIVTCDKVPAEKALIAIGGTATNPLIATAQQKQLVNFKNLKPEGFILKNIELDGHSVLIVGGNDEAGTMYAAYELLERLGVVFQLTNDIIPQHKSELAMPVLDVRMEPLLKYRGMHCCHGLRWYMGLDDFRKHIDQLAKLKLNCLQFYIGMGSPWVRFSYGEKTAVLLYPKESGWVAWGGTSWGTTSGTAKEVIVGKECFPQDYIGPPEFAKVESPKEAFAVAREFLHEVIRYAHQRKVEVWLMLGEIPYIPPNLIPPGVKRLHTFYCGVAIPPGVPALLDIWESAVQSMVETYPEADAYGVWTSELYLPTDDSRTQEMLRAYPDVKKLIPSVSEIHQQGNTFPKSPASLDSDLAQIAVVEKLVQRVKRRLPDVRFGVATLFRNYLLRALDSLLPKDVWLMNMETYANTRSVMHSYGDLSGRELLVMPRIDDDGCELNMQLNAMRYEHDEIIAGSVRYGVAGIVGQLNKERGLECNVRYIAEGAWNPAIRCQSFYESYLGRIYGVEARDPLVKAYLLLEENEKALGWNGRRGIFIGFNRFSPCHLRTNVDYKQSKLEFNRQQLEREIEAAEKQRKFWEIRIAHCRQAMESLLVAQPKVLSGSRTELEYVIFKTKNFISYLEVLAACEQANATLDRAWLAKSIGDEAEFGKQLDLCHVALERADRLARESAQQMTRYCNVPTERYLLFRYNQNVIRSIQRCQDFLSEVITWHKEGENR